MKKTISILLVMVLCYSTITISPVLGKNVAKSFSSDTIYNLSKNGIELTKSKSQLGKRVVNTTIQFDNYSNNLNTLEASGKVFYSDGSYIPFNLSGTFKNRGIENDQTVIIDLEDKLGNYEVIYSYISNNVKKVNLFNKQKANSNANSLFALYLLDQNRNFTVIEITNPDFINVEDIIGNIANIEEAKTEDILWHSKLLKVGKEMVITTIENENIFGVKSNTNTDSHTFLCEREYTYFGSDFTESMEVEARLHFDSSIGSTASGSVEIDVESNKITDENGDVMPKTVMCVGKEKDTIVDIVLAGENKNGFVKLMTVGKANTARKVNIGFKTDLSWSCSTPIPNVSFNIDLTGGENNVEINDAIKGFPNDPNDNEFTRRIKSEIDKDYVIKETKDHLFKVCFDVKDFSSDDNDDNTIAAKVNLTFYSNMDGYSKSKSTVLKLNYTDE